MYEQQVEQSIQQKGTLKTPLLKLKHLCIFQPFYEIANVQDVRLEILTHSTNTYQTSIIYNTEGRYYGDILKSSQSNKIDIASRQLRYEVDIMRPKGIQMKKYVNSGKRHYFTRKLINEEQATGENMAEHKLPDLFLKIVTNYLKHLFIYYTVIKYLLLKQECFFHMLDDIIVRLPR